MSTHEVIVNWAMVAAVLLLAASFVGPYFDDASGTIAFITMCAGVVAAIGTPVSIIVAVNLHNRSVEEPKQDAAKRANDMLWAIVDPMIVRMANNLTDLYATFIAIEDKGPDELAHRKLAAGRAKNIAHALDALGKRFEQNGSHVSALPDGTRIQFQEIVERLTALPLSDSLFSGESSRLRASIILLEQALCDIWDLRELLQRPTDGSNDGWIEKDELEFLRGNRERYLKLAINSGISHDPSSMRPPFAALQ